MPPLVCSSYWNLLTLSSDGTQVYALCDIASQMLLQASVYNLTDQTVSASSNVTNFELLVLPQYAMCPYGQKILVSGTYEKIGGYAAPWLSIWDNQYQQWY